MSESIKINKIDKSRIDDVDFSLEPFTERFDNVVSGWNCNFSITLPHNYFTCNNFNWVFDDETSTFINGTAKDCTLFSNAPNQ